MIRTQNTESGKEVSRRDWRWKYAANSSQSLSMVRCFIGRAAGMIVVSGSGGTTARSGKIKKKTSGGDSIAGAQTAQQSSPSSYHLFSFQCFFITSSILVHPKTRQRLPTPRRCEGGAARRSLSRRREGTERMGGESEFSEQAQGRQECRRKPSFLHQSAWHSRNPAITWTHRRLMRRLSNLSCHSREDRRLEMDGVSERSKSHKGIA